MTAVTSLVDTALTYAARGWRIVPIRPGEKRPAMDRWTVKATTDTDLLTGWWRAHPDHGIGIATGPASGIFVLDIDISDGKHGDETLHNLEQRHGPLPDTVEVITGSGGRHLYFQYPEGIDIRNDAGRRLGPGLDIRGDGGQVVAPPTIHPSGTRYEWELEHDPDTTPVAPAPTWLIAMLIPDVSAVAALTNGAAPSTILQDDDRPGTIFERDTNWPDILTADGWTHAHTDRNGEHHWTRPGKDPRQGTSATVGYQGLDVLHVFTSSVAGLHPEQTYNRFAYYVATRHGGDYTAAANQLADTATRNQLADWQHFIDTSRVTPLVDLDTAGCELGQWAINWPDFWNRDHNDTEWLCEPFLAAGRQHAIHAGAKTGKSLLTLEVCAALATGRAVLDQPAGPPIHVLYVDYEMTPADLHDRLTTFGYNGQPLEHLHYVQLPSIDGLDTLTGGRTVVEAAHHYQAQLVVIDTTARAVEGPENDADTFRAFYRHTGLGLKAIGATLVRIDHSGKEKGRGQRGSSAKNDDVDIVWELTRLDGGGLHLKATHRRVGWVPDSFDVTLTDNGDGTSTHKLTDPGWPQGTQAAADLLAGRGLPSDATVKESRAALTAGGHSMSNALLATAVKYRKSLAAATIDPDWNEEP